MQAATVIAATPLGVSGDVADGTVLAEPVRHWRRSCKHSGNADPV